MDRHRAWLLSLALAACGGGKGSAPPRPPPPPQNVAATAGNHSLHATWDPVPGATGYRVYVAQTPIATPAGLVSASVAASPYDATGVANWVALHLRVSAVGPGGEGPLSAEVVATPSAGWIVGTHTAGGSTSLDFLHADEPNAPVDGILGGHLVGIGPSRSPYLGAAALLYGVGGSPPWDDTESYLEIGLAAGGSHLAYTDGTAMGYVFFGVAGARVIYRDGLGSAYSVKSQRVAGGDERTLAGPGCNVLPLSGQPYSPVRFVDPDGAGAVFECSSGSTYRIYYSDGLSPAMPLPEAGDERPFRMAPDRVFFQNATTGAIHSRVFSAALGDTVGLSYGVCGSAPEDLVAVERPATSTSARMLVVSGVSGANAVRSCDLRGADVVALALNQPDPFKFWDVVADGSAVLLSSANPPPYNTFMALASATAPSPIVDLSGGSSLPDYARLLPGDRVAVHQGPTSGYFKILDRFTGAGTVQVGVSNGAVAMRQFIGASGDWMVAYDHASSNLWGFRVDGTASNRFSTTFVDATAFFFLPNRRVIWREGDGTTWVADVDFTLGLSGISPTRVDPVPADVVVPAGYATDPERIFYVAIRGGGSQVDTMVVDVAAVATDSAVLVAGGAAGSFDGRLVP